MDARVQDHIINTAKVIVWYLKKVDFHGEVFAIASETFQNVLKKAGFQLTEEVSKWIVQSSIFIFCCPSLIITSQDNTSVRSMLT